MLKKMDLLMGVDTQLDLNKQDNLSLFVCTATTQYEPVNLETCRSTVILPPSVKDIGCLLGICGWVRDRGRELSSVCVR